MLGWRMRLILIEDHERFAKFVKNGLKKEVFTIDAVDTASSGENYLLKPFAMEELVIRIRVLLGRPGGVSVR